MDKKFIYGAAALICLVAILPLPYGFYTFVRLAVTAASVLAAIQLKNKENFLWVVFAGVALLFNPLFPVYLDRDIWFFIDLIVSGLFGWMTFKVKE